jgi:hypothetical protein
MSKKLIEKNNNKHKPIKKKLSLSYKLTFSFLIILTLSLFYFVILVSAKPMSFPALNSKVQEVLKKNFGNDVKLEKTFVSFTRYGTIRIVGSNISLFYESTDNNKMEIQKQALILPRIEAEFSIIKMLFLQFQPSKILIIDPKVTINLSSLSPSNSVDNSSGDLSAITQFLQKMRKGDIIIEKFELQNANLVLIDGDLTNQIFIKQAKIRADAHKKDLSIESQGDININNDENVASMAMECMFFKDSRLQCDANIKNFAPKSIAGFHHRLSDFDKIFTKLDGNIKLKMNQKKIKNIEFNLTANQGSFNLAQYFSKKIDLKNFKIRGDYDHEIGMLNLSQIEGDFISEINDKNGISNPHFLMSLMFSRQQNQSLKMDFFIRTQNILQAELEKYWPINLDQNGVRKWVTEHVSDGLIKNAFAKFTVLTNKNNSETELVDINSEVIFSEMNLRYDQYFPELKNLLGIARFNKNNMEISISHGEVLQSKIDNVIVTIDDFNAPMAFLKISGNLQGPAFDTLKHANCNSNFAKEVEKYLNGEAKTIFNISLPLQENLNLEQISLVADSQVQNLKNDYLRGDVNIKINKNIHSNNFLSEVDLTKAEIDLKDFDITKNNNIDSNLKFTIAVNNNENILIKDIDLYKTQEIKKNNKNIQITGSIKGEFDLDIVDPKIKSLKLANQNFGNNNFKLSYNYDDKKNIPKLNIAGQKLYAGGLLQSKIFNQNKKQQNSKYFDNLQVTINLNRVELLRQKFLRNFNLFLNCKNASCPVLSISGNYDKLQTINLQATKKPKDDFVSINGRITDIGYLCEGLGISNLIADGNTLISLKQKNIDKKMTIEGNIEIDDEITIFENETVKKFASDNLYSQIKDSIFSSNKTTFNSIKIDFILQKQIIKINSLIANNFKIGITSKGEIDLSSGAINLRGMIIPGYIVNSLFGIGKIPLIGSVISGILTGGQGGGLFGLRYEYVKNANNKEGKFTTNKVSAFVPSTIQNLFVD